MSALHDAAQRLIDLQDMDRVEIIRQFGHNDDWLIACRRARDVLRAALAQQPEPAQEPYCHVYEYDSVFGLHREFYPCEYNGRKPDRTLPLYTAPPQRKPLTDEEILSVLRLAPPEPSLWPHLKDEAVVGDVQRAVLAIARAIERFIQSQKGEKE